MAGRVRYQHHRNTVLLGLYSALFATVFETDGQRSMPTCMVE